MESQDRENQAEKTILSDEKLSQIDEEIHLTEKENHSHRHSSHHHSSHRHRSETDEKKKKKSAKKRKAKRFFRKLGATVKKNWGSLLCIVILLSLLIALLIISSARLDEITPAPSTDPTQSEDEESIRLSLPFFTEEQTLISDAALACLSVGEGETVQTVLAPFRESGRRLDVGLPVTLEFSVSGIPVGHFLDTIKVEVDENEDFLAPRVYHLDATKRSVDLYFLKTATKYHYRITLLFSGDLSTAMTGSFVTADTPRILSVEGLVNVRDIGGWKTKDGRVIRQGMLIRGSELDGAVEESYDVSSTGLMDALTVLGIRTDMDLRAETDNVDHTHALGANVKHRYYDVAMYEGILQKGQGERVCAVFSDLAKPETYPVYLHCTYGADRTGTICFLLEALLGLSEEDLVREYELTTLYHTSVTAENLTALRQYLDSLEGDSLQEKTENYLLSIGVTAAEIESIRSILLTD